MLARGKTDETPTFSYRDFGGLQNADGFGYLPCPPEAAAQVTHDAPELELDVGACAGATHPGMSAVGVLPSGGLVRALVSDAQVIACTGVALIGPARRWTPPVGQAHNVPVRGITSKRG